MMKKIGRIPCLCFISALLGAMLMLTLYLGIYFSGFQKVKEPSLITIEDNAHLHRFNYILYHELYNVTHNVRLTYTQLYCRNALPVPEISEELREAGYTQEAYNTAFAEVVSRRQQFMENALEGPKSNFSAYTKKYYDYWIQDLTTGQIITNTTYHAAGEKPSAEDYVVYVELGFNHAGVMNIQKIKDTDAEALRKQLYDYTRESMWDNLARILQYEELSSEDADLITDIVNNNSYLLNQAIKYENPRDCYIIYGIDRNAWEEYTKGYTVDLENSHIWNRFRIFRFNLVYLIMVCFMAVLGFFRFEKGKGRGIPFEVVTVALIYLFYLEDFILERSVNLFQNHVPGTYHCPQLTKIGLLLHVAAFCGWLFLFMVAWSAGYFLGEIRKVGIRSYLKERCFFIWLIRQGIGAWRKYYASICEITLTENWNKKLKKFMILNGILLFLFCGLWFLGWAGLILYLLILTYYLKKYIKTVQTEYEVLQRGLNRIAEGDFKTCISEEMGVFEPLRPSVMQIGDGFSKAVDEEVKSQKMKSELITNVSHDLKTPLTAIITYINLLKEEGVTPEEQQKYLKVLEDKSLRLKSLIEDLFEVSKANSGNVTLHMAQLDLVNLIKQTALEFEDKLSAKDITCRLRLPEEKVLLTLDGQKTYRIYENLFGNISKYAMRGTRVYVDLIQDEEKVSVMIKNITETELNVNASELTERFVRGDASRHEEGNGLGLAIVKSFAELMGGSFEVKLDGDLFTAITTWKKNKDLNNIT